MFMKLPVLLFLLSVSFVGVSLGAQEDVIWSESFEGSVGSAKAYRGGELLEAVQEGGSSFLRVTLPGKETLEGVTFGLGDVEGSALMLVSAKLRGSGIIGPMIQVGDIWTRLPEITLSDQWQEVLVPRSLKSGKNLPLVYFVSLEKEGATADSVFEISDLKAVLAPPLELPHTEVNPQRYEMEDFAPQGSVVSNQDGEGCVMAQTSFATEEIPFPQTGQPVSVYVRFRPASLDDSMEVITRRGGAKQVLRSGKPSSDGWLWMEFSDLEANEVGDVFTIESWPKIGASQPGALDALVITTEPHLDETTLDAIK